MRSDICLNKARANAKKSVSDVGIRINQSASQKRNVISLKSFSGITLPSIPSRLHMTSTRSSFYLVGKASAVFPASAFTRAHR